MDLMGRQSGSSLSFVSNLTRDVRQFVVIKVKARVVLC